MVLKLIFDENGKILELKLLAKLELIKEYDVIATAIKGNTHGL